jgi:hypothetical protein
MTVASEVEFGPYTIGVKVDVVLLDPCGYVARIPLWDKEPMPSMEMKTLAAPIVEAISVELGAGRAVGVDFWHLRTSAAAHVATADARQATSTVEAIVRRYVGEA